MESSELREADSGERALSPVVAVVFLFGLVVVSAAIVFVAGSSAVFAVQEDTNTEQATKSMASIAADLESSGNTDVELPSEGSSYVDANSSWMRVEVGNATVVDEDEGRLGTLYYETDGTTVAYEGGGVWRHDSGQRSTVLTPPPLQYSGADDPTLDLPVISIAGDASGPVGRDQLSTVRTETTYPNATLSNPIVANVTITVDSQFYYAWGTYFDSRFDADVTYDPSATQTTVVLQGATRNRTFDQSEWDPPEMEGIPGFIVNDGSQLHARQDASVDSYDSSAGPYGASTGSEGDLKTTGELLLSNDAFVDGDVDSGGTATISNNVEVTGDLVVGEGDASTYTLIDTSSGPSTTIGGVFSTKEDAEITGGVEFGDDVIVGGDLDSFEATVAGDVYVHGDMVDINDDYDGQIDGDLVVAGAVNWDEDDVALDVDGEFVANASAGRLRPPLEPAVEVVEPAVNITQKGDEFRTDNDNNDTYGAGWGGYGGGYGGSPYGPIDNRQLQNCGTAGPYSNGCELDAGQYYLDEIDLYGDTGPYSDPEELTLNTTNGPIEIYVESTVNVEGTASIQVEHGPDEHPVKLYVEDDVTINQGGEIDVPDQRAPLFELYMQPDAEWTIEGGSRFVGGVYGLSDGTQRTEIDISGVGGTSIFGGFLGAVDVFDQDGRVHYDEALSEEDYDRPDDETGGGGGTVHETIDTDGADVVYLHVDRRTVEAD